VAIEHNVLIIFFSAWECVSTPLNDRNLRTITARAMAKKIIKTHYVSVASDRFLWRGFLSGKHSDCKMAL
jgi:hypothetical protein